MVQHVPGNGNGNGNGAATGPVTVSEQPLTASGNSASLTVPRTDSVDGCTATLLSPSYTAVSTVAMAQRSGKWPGCPGCLHGRRRRRHPLQLQRPGEPDVPHGA
ncbi:hypothetical protein [Streptomyces sp. Ru72]|uniref:hypothetical protein n=1 Tax=Streptomyces sp. Ru72 TaxID=2080747 RepID=UPI0011B0DE67|nr:hypothetical protein [Streptomyces sp. Ru72]